MAGRGARGASMLDGGGGVGDGEGGAEEGGDGGSEGGGAPEGAPKSNADSQPNWSPKASVGAASSLTPGAWLLYHSESPLARSALDSRTLASSATSLRCPSSSTPSFAAAIASGRPS